MQNFEIWFTHRVSKTIYGIWTNQCYYIRILVFFKYIWINNCWVCIWASFCNNLPWIGLNMIIHIGFYFVMKAWNEDSSHYRAKGRKLRDRSIYVHYWQKITIVESWEGLTLQRITQTKWYEVQFWAKDKRENYPQMDGRITNIDISCDSCFSPSILMIFT